MRFARSSYYKRTKCKTPRLMVARDLYQREAATLALSANRPADAELVRSWCQIQRRHPISRGNALH